MACDKNSLEESACSNGFWQAAQTEVQYRALVLQMLCNGFSSELEAPLVGEGMVPIVGEGGIPIFQ